MLSELQTANARELLLPLPLHAGTAALLPGAPAAAAAESALLQRVRAPVESLRSPGNSVFSKPGLVYYPR